MYPDWSSVKWYVYESPSPCLLKEPHANCDTTPVFRALPRPLVEVGKKGRGTQLRKGERLVGVVRGVSRKTALTRARAGKLSPANA